MNIILPTASNKNIEIGTWNVPSYHTYLARYSSHVVISKLGRLENSLAVYILKHFARILNQELLELFLDFCAMPT